MTKKASPRIDDPFELQLLERARGAALRAHAPYSKFRVGAAIWSGGTIVEGCNVENASFGLTMCAERVALFSSRSAGLAPATHIALSCIDATEGSSVGSKMPCGACRQVIAELAAPHVRVIVDGAGSFRLEDLLPSAFLLDTE